jgi:hypothetical protein
MSCDGTTLFGPTNLATTSGWVNIQTNIEFGAVGPGSAVLQFGFNDPDNGFALDDIRLQWTDVPVNGWFTYTTNNDGTFNLAGCSGCGGALIIPGWINLTPVTSIGNHAFQNNTSLTSVTFAGNSLTSRTTNVVTLNSSHVTTIGVYAFAGCTYLTNATIGNSVTNIGQDAFLSCISLTSVTIGNGVASIGGGAFWECTSLASVTIPNSVTSIGSVAFSSCISLTNVTIGNSVKNIGYEAFLSCPSLISVTIPNSVTNIADEAFSACTGLTNVYYMGNAPSLGGLNVFLNDTSATNYYMPGTMGWGTPGVTLYDGRPTALWTVPNWGYVNNSGTITLTGYTGPGGAVTIPSPINGLPVTSIGNNAFAGLTSLTSVTIPTSVTNIGNGAFGGCTGLTSVTIPTNVTSIGTAPFAGCTSLTAITVGASNPAYCSVAGVLFNKSQTTLIQFPGGVSGSYTIPDGVTSIGANAFNGCASLTSVTIPASVTSIADSAFQNCGSLSGVYFLGNPPSLGGLSIFLNDNNAIGYNAAETTGWGLTFDGLTMVLANNSTINGTNHYAYGANLGWVDWRGDATHGAVIGTNICSGYIYSANFGWINLGNGSPANGNQYQNNSASDFGVNVDSSGNLSGYAYGANLGWINFTNIGTPQVDLASGSLTGSVWSANWGWISLSNTVASVQTSAPQQSSPPVTAPILGGLKFASGGGGFGFSFTNVPGASSSFTVWATTNLAQPFSNWTWLGHPTEVPDGSYSQYQFTDPLAGNQVKQFYRVTSP